MPNTTTEIDRQAIQSRIAGIAVQHGDWKVRLSALDFVDDVGLLDRLSEGDPTRSVRLLAAQCCVEVVERERGELGLIDLAHNARTSHVRVLAIGRIRSKDALTDLASSPFDERVRVAAIERIEAQAVLCGAALNDPHWEVRLAATRKLRSQSILEQIARRDRSRLVRFAAVERLDDPGVLAHIATSDHAAEVAEQAQRGLAALETRPVTRVALD